jgi:hypothetical protein
LELKNKTEDFINNVSDIDIGKDVIESEGKNVVTNDAGKKQASEELSPGRGNKESLTPKGNNIKNFCSDSSPDQSGKKQRSQKKKKT